MGSKREKTNEEIYKKKKNPHLYYGSHLASSSNNPLPKYRDPLDLSLSLPPPPPPPPPPPHPLYQTCTNNVAVRRRRNPTQAPRNGKSEIVPAPFPWATQYRATVHSLEYLRSNGINTISGNVHCKRCDQQYVIEYDLEAKFAEVAAFIVSNRSSMHDRAPKQWMNPDYPTCRFCHQANCVKPIMGPLKKQNNWLFMLLGQTLGSCTLAYLKYFCKHTKNHRTGAKDRVLYLTYLCLCKQLDPTGPFDR